MYTAILIIHILVCLFLIFVILIQSSKGAEMGAAFGGSSQTLFGSRGAATFMNKLTTGVAVAFMITSLTLAVFTIRKTSVMSSVPVKSAPAQPLSVPDAGPLQEKPSAPGQGDVQQTPPPPAQAK